VSTYECTPESPEQAKEIRDGICRTVLSFHMPDLVAKGKIIYKLWHENEFTGAKRPNFYKKDMDLTRQMKRFNGYFERSRFFRFDEPILINYEDFEKTHKEVLHHLHTTPIDLPFDVCVLDSVDTALAVVTGDPAYKKEFGNVFVFDFVPTSWANSIYFHVVSSS